MKVVVAGFSALLSHLIITDYWTHLAFSASCHRGTVLIHTPWHHIRTKKFICEKHMMHSKAEENISPWDQTASLCQDAVWHAACPPDSTIPYHEDISHDRKVMLLFTEQRGQAQVPTGGGSSSGARAGTVLPALLYYSKKLLMVKTWFKRTNLSVFVKWGYSR